jgi:NADP-dependent 3-hydroxy acid dehydrogenase YdfG/acyl carrier protein
LRRDDFAEQVLAARHGRPLEIVVFVEAIDPALHNRIPLAFGGRVLLYGPAVGSVDPTRFFDPATTYSLHRVDPVALAASNSALYRAALARFAEGQRSPIDDDCDLTVPAGEFPGLERSELRSGWSVTIDMRAMGEVASSATGDPGIDGDAAYVITGGFGGFGIATAGHLIRMGARYVVLVGRSGATSNDARNQIASWRGEGVNIREALLDVTDPDAVDALFVELSTERAVRGVIHAAGVVDDVRIADMTPEQLARVIAPKLHGAWNLHASCIRHRLELDHFVLFSSVASLVGNGAQANYVAGNAALDSLAAHRRAHGSPATSINWGALAEVGMATNEDLLRQFRLMGIRPFSSGEAMIGLDAVLCYRPTQIGIMDVDWPQWGRFEPTGGKSPRFAHLTGQLGGDADDSIAGSLCGLPPQERLAMAEFMLAERVAQTLRIPAERIDVKQPLTDMGIDSLMAVELQIGINMTFGVELSALELTRGFSITQLATPLLERMGISSAPLPDDSNGDLDVEGLSESELDAILAAARDSDRAA